MEKYDSIVQKIAQIINLCSSAYVYRIECSCVAKVLNEISSQISKLQTKTDNDELDTILSQLDNLHKIVESFNIDKWTQTNLQVPISKPITDINEAMTSITKSLQKIGITLENNYQNSTDDIFNDLNSIYGILANPNKKDDPVVKSKLEEIEQYLKDIGKPLFNAQAPKSIDTNSDIHTSSTVDVSTKFSDFNDVQKYKLKETDFEYDKPPLTKTKLYSIHKGKMADTKEDVTVTIFNKESFNDDKYKRLINVLTALNHANLETFIGALANPPPYIVVTKANGEKLSELIEEHKEEEEIQANDDEDDDDEDDDEDDDKEDEAKFKNYKTIIAFQIATAMAYLHSIGIIHRDLCSANVTVDSEFNARVTNFASSRYVPTEVAFMTFDPSSSSRFKAPELYNPDGYNEMVDVFAFGGILYELLTGEVPFKGADNRKVLNMIANKKRPKIPPETDENLRELIESCWAQDWHDRPSFATIINNMLTNSITFPSDKDSEITKQFYAAKKIKNVGFKSCFDLINQIQEAINNSFVYKQEAYRIRTLLYGYLFVLETSKYARLTTIDDENVNTQIDNLSFNLENLLLAVKQTEIDKWSTIALSTPSLEIPNDMLNFMEQIYISLKQIGFDVIKYSHVPSDLQSDLRYVYYILADNGSVKARKRMSEISEYMDENDMEIEMTDEEINEKVKALLTTWQDLSVDRKDFELSSMLGDGVSCQVYKAVQHSTNKEVAIKIFKNDYFDDDDKILLLRREIASLMTLKNDYLIEFIGFNVDPGEPLWIVMENVEGGSLEKAIEGDMLGPYEKTKVAFEIAQGMEYLNMHSIIHRDLKSANILLDEPDTIDVKPKICDFGYARSDLSSSIKKTSNVGTINYMAPEVILGEYYDYKADVFSFGQVLFELYSGKSPYYWVKKANIMKYITDNRPLRYNEPINENLKNLIEDCRNFDADKRPSFTEIIERMISEKICFDDAPEDYVDDFYNEKIEERKNMK